MGCGFCFLVFLLFTLCQTLVWGRHIHSAVYSPQEFNHSLHLIDEETTGQFVSN